MEWYLDARPAAPGAVEIAERKGTGHPDTMCDALTERLSLELSRLYEERFGTILHHNVDKALLWGGAAEPAFGGGRVTAPIEIYLAGRATREVRGETLPVDELVQEVTRQWLTENLHALDAQRDVRVHSLIRPGSADLTELFLRRESGGVWYANDTSVGVGFAPLSEVERAVDAAERRINAPDFKAAHPETGEDVKVMGVRRGDTLHLTVGCAMVDRHLDDLDAYLAARTAVANAVREAAAGVTDLELDVAVNAADVPEHESIYLTTTGTSAEAGDDGEAGRGNRVNGLITPYRPMTMESVAGKNPVTHVGKVYNLIASRAAEAMVREVDGIEGAEVYLVSEIGRPVPDPQAAHVRLSLADSTSAAGLEAEARRLLNAELEASPDLWRLLLDGTIACDRWPL